MIEDAQKAIFASYVFAELEIEYTTFNRNITGIWLEHAQFAANPPFISKLSHTLFSCDAPIVGTTNQISENGIYILNNPLFFSISSDADVSNNQFRKLKYGIKIDGQSTVLRGRNLLFREIYYSCIQIAKGRIDLANSNFLDYGDNGIKVYGLQGLKLNYCNFQVSTSRPHYISSPSLKRQAVSLYSDTDFPATVNIFINKSTFHYSCPTVNETYDGVLTSLFQSKKNVIISYNDFSVQGTNANGIHINGFTNDVENWEIFQNTFSVGASLYDISASTQFQATGLNVLGKVNALHIVGNTFNGTVDNTDTQYSQDYGINLQGLVGNDNKILDNNFYGPFWAGAGIESTPDLKICSNSGFFVNRIFYFKGDNLNTDFSQNAVGFGGFDIQGKIGLQDQKDNAFYSLLPIVPSYVRCLSGDCNNYSKFLVRQNLGTEFYPDFQFCSAQQPCLAIEEFFKNQNTTANGACVDEFQNPGDQAFFLSIANSNISDPSEYYAKKWFYESFLYQKLKYNATLLGSDAAYASFIQNKLSSSIEQFYNVEETLKNAHNLSTIYDNQIDSLQNRLQIIESQTAEVDSLLNIGFTSNIVQNKKTLITAWQNTCGELESVLVARKGLILIQAQAALNINNSIVANTSYETNTKTLNQILLTSYISQDGLLNESQISQLKAIGQQCYKQGGHTVFQAIAALKECDIVYPVFSENCEEENVPPITFPEEMERQLSQPQLSFSQEPLKMLSSGNTIYIIFPEDFIGSVNIFDLTGRLIHSQNVNAAQATSQLTVSNLPSGVCFISAISTSRIYTGKVIVSH